MGNARGRARLGVRGRPPSGEAQRRIDLVAASTRLCPATAQGPALRGLVLESGTPTMHTLCPRARGIDKNAVLDTSALTTSIRRTATSFGARTQVRCACGWTGLPVWRSSTAYTWTTPCYGKRLSSPSPSNDDTSGNGGRKSHDHWCPTQDGLFHTETNDGLCKFCTACHNGDDRRRVDGGGASQLSRLH